VHRVSLARVIASGGDMVISRERHLDDTARYHVALTLQTRTHEMHSLLSDAPDDVRVRLGEILVEALDHVEAVLRTRVTAVSTIEAAKR
jgi:hypothetical protein